LLLIKNTVSLPRLQTDAMHSTTYIRPKESYSQIEGNENARSKHPKVQVTNPSRRRQSPPRKYPKKSRKHSNQDSNDITRLEENETGNEPIPDTEKYETDNEPISETENSATRVNKSASQNVPGKQTIRSRISYHSNVLYSNIKNDTLMKVCAVKRGAKTGQCDKTSEFILTEALRNNSHFDSKRTSVQLDDKLVNKLMHLQAMASTKAKEKQQQVEDMLLQKQAGDLCFLIKVKNEEVISTNLNCSQSDEGWQVLKRVKKNFLIVCLVICSAALYLFLYDLEQQNECGCFRKNNTNNTQINIKAKQNGINNNVSCFVGKQENIGYFRTLFRR